jgi:tetratricopeptide (TPR) repeat protein
MEEPADVDQPNKTILQQAPQIVQSQEKPCQYCKTPIDMAATVCRHCRMYQFWVKNYLSQLGIIISLGLLIMSTLNFWEAKGQRTKAEEALQKAEKIEKVVGQAQSLLNLNLLLTKAVSDDRKAFDELRKISSIREDPYYDVAYRAVNTMVWSNSTSPINPSLIQELQLLDYNKLLEYYQQTSNIDSSSILFSIDGNTNMNDEEKADFMARIIEEDGSFRVVQRTCCYIKARLERYRQVKPDSHNRVIAMCKIYGKLWEHVNVRC